MRWSQDEQIDLVALAWLGRDGTGAGDWPDSRREAARAHNERTAGYLLGMPMLADFLEEGCPCSACPVKNSRSAVSEPL